MAKKINIDEIDENFVIASVKKDRTAVLGNTIHSPLPATVEQPEQSTHVLPEVSKEDNRRKRNKQDYEALFIKESNITARFGKTVYIRKEYHDRILKIVRVIGGNELSLFSYIDNVLAHHFDSFQDEITQLYDKKNSSIF